MHETKRALIIFTRVPIPGRTKTRMEPQLSKANCARLHSCFLKDIGQECTKVQADLFVFYTPDHFQERLYPAFGPSAVYLPQKGEGLGARMYEAIRHVLSKGYSSCILCGTDIPELLAEDLEQAFSRLDACDVVLGPTEDGGYYLVGMKKPEKAVFQAVPYGNGSVLERTVEQAQRAGLSVALVKEQKDMDHFEDLEGLWRRMWKKKCLETTATGRFLARIRSISIIVPIYNEERTIGMIQDQLRPLLGKCEILFVDGGSTDRTLSLIGPEFRVIPSEKGRAKQMNTGAMASSGQILFFLHCDSELPPHVLGEIRRVMAGHLAGCFGIAFHSRNFFMFTCRVISNHRIKDRKVMFGDQGIFLDRDLFFEIGMFPEIPVMEDYQLSLTLKEQGIRLGMTKRRIYTSDRRFPKGTVPKLKLMWKMNRLRKMYRDGVPIERISRLYRDVR